MSDIEVRIEGGPVLRFPEGTSESIIDARVQEIVGRGVRPTQSFASPVIDPRFYQAGEAAEDISTQPSINEVDPFAMSEAGVNIGTPESRQMAQRLVNRGMTLGLSAPLGAAKRSLQTDTPFSEQFAQDAEQMRQYQEAIGPAASAATEISGGAMSPLSILGLPRAVMQMGAGKRAATTSGVGGAVYGASTEEGGVLERGQRAIEVAVPSALFGLGSEKVVIPTINKTFGALLRKNAEAPTVEDLKRARDLAYKEVDKVETVFGPDDYNQFMANASKRIEGSNYVPEVDREVAAAIQMLTKKQGMAMTLGEMDKLRQGLWSRHSNAAQQPGQQMIIRDIIDEVDLAIDAKLGASNALTGARLANSQYKKAQLLEESFEAAQRQAAATGSGGNVENLYRQAVNRILKNQKQRRFFAPQEIEAMEAFIRGDMTQNISRLIGKLSPSGNGLMMALNIGAVATDPMMVLGTMAGASSKAFADARIQKQAKEIIEMMGGVRGLAPDSSFGMGAGPAAVISGQVTD